MQTLRERAAELAGGFIHGGVDSYTADNPELIADLADALVKRKFEFDFRMTEVNDVQHYAIYRKGYR